MKYWELKQRELFYTVLYLFYKGNEGFACAFLAWPFTGNEVMLHFAQMQFQNYRKHRLDDIYLFGAQWLEGQVNTAPRRVGSFLEIELCTWIFRLVLSAKMDQNFLLF